MMTTERRIYLAVMIVATLVSAGLPYVLVRVASSNQPPLLIAAVALACIEGMILAWIAYRRFRLGRSADIAGWVRAGSVLTCVVIVLLFAPRLRAVLHH